MKYLTLAIILLSGCSNSPQFINGEEAEIKSGFDKGCIVRLFVYHSYDDSYEGRVVSCPVAFWEAGFSTGRLGAELLKKVDKLKSTPIPQCSTSCSIKP